MQIMMDAEEKGSTISARDQNQVLTWELMRSSAKNLKPRVMGFVLYPIYSWNMAHTKAAFFGNATQGTGGDRFFSTETHSKHMGRGAGENLLTL